MSEYWYPLAVNTIGEEEIDAVTAVLRSGQTTMGAKVEQFEEEFARYVQAPEAIMVNSGSSADLLAAFSVDTTGHVVVPAVTWPTHVWSWEQSGATVKFCDVDGINTNASLIQEALTQATRVVSLPHLMGVPVDLTGVKSQIIQKSLLLHEDCCEALGAKYNHGGATGWKPVGWAADVASWSFFFSHQMTTMEGGMVTTPHADVARKVRSLRSHGWTRHFRPEEKYTFHDQGFNLRPTEVAAAMGLVQLRKLDLMNSLRADRYREFERKLLKHPDIYLPTVPANAKPSWFGVPMFVKRGRDQLAAYLEEEGVETRPILAGNLKNQPGFKGFYFGKTPGADLLDAQGLYVGLSPGADKVAKMVADFL